MIIEKYPFTSDIVSLSRWDLVKLWFGVTLIGSGLKVTLK